MKQIEERDCICSGCGKVHNNRVHSMGRVVVEDLPISGKSVFLHVPKRKGICLEDDSIRVEELNWISGRFTKRFAWQVYRLTSITTNKEAGWFLGIDDETVYRIERSISSKNYTPMPRDWESYHATVSSTSDCAGFKKQTFIWRDTYPLSCHKAPSLICPAYTPASACATLPPKCGQFQGLACRAASGWNPPVRSSRCQAMI